MLSDWRGAASIVLADELNPATRAGAAVSDHKAVVNDASEAVTSGGTRLELPGAIWGVIGLLLLVTTPGLLPGLPVAGCRPVTGGWPVVNNPLVGVVPLLPLPPDE
ncbi:hypothetical protein J7438_25555 [Thalassotalea sp. G20_0]|uniref:hypothetical protein n=1 Tax=Thalassotalea sp. G20_0 TaxID=2821093 RepID=UPI001ADD5A30|nr:hypothetical protein [Thalassotalea sp. G20_0]MBO9497424.1 hypothetical protein [Thalassotalea sp. G20_0]